MARLGEDRGRPHRLHRKLTANRTAGIASALRAWRQGTIPRYGGGAFVVVQSFADYLPFTLLTQSLQNNR